MPALALLLSGVLLRLTGRLDDRLDDRLIDRERGDVPGWVLITIMTAGLVTAIWVVAKDQLETILENALQAVKGPSSP